MIAQTGRLLRMRDYVRVEGPPRETHRKHRRRVKIKACGGCNAWNCQRCWPCNIVLNEADWTPRPGSPRY